ncbi:MAG: DUF2007 domain-containing protein [Candidatus Hydrogenedentota bacterium]
MVTIRTFRSQAEAALYQSVLDSRGIDSFLGNEIATSFGYGETIGGIDLMVDPGDVDAALRVLKGAPEDGDRDPIYYSGR